VVTILLCALIALVVLRCMVKSHEAREIWLLVIAVLATTMFAMLFLPR
jgi:hypothetical protein